VSRVRENRMHGSMRRREETGTSRASTSRTEPGASRRPDRLTPALGDARLRERKEERAASGLMHVRFVHGTELHVVLACRGVEPLDVRLLDGKWFDVFEPRRLPEVPEEPLEARRHEAREHSRRFGGRVPKCMEGPARHMQELPWSQPASGVLKEDVDAALDHEEELVRVPVYMG
jgi:hypothetical protein